MARIDRINKHLKQELRLFLSVDIIGSTKYKSLDIEEWLPIIFDFYNDFPSVYQNKLDESPLKKDKKGKKAEYPNIWKAIGDELVFTVNLKDNSYIRYYIEAFRLAIREFSNKPRQKHKHTIGLKATAWIAGFPVINSKVPFEDKTKQIDFIGPLIDIGFRLSQYATDRKFIISVDLAYLLLEKTDVNLKFFFEGRKILKNVNLPKNYPIIWIDIYEDDEFDKRESKLLKQEECGFEELRKYCEDFIISYGSKMIILPFIDKKYGKKPDWYDEAYNRVEELYYKNIRGKEFDEGIPSKIDEIKDKIEKLRDNE